MIEDEGEGNWLAGLLIKRDFEGDITEEGSR